MPDMNEILKGFNPPMDGKDAIPYTLFYRPVFVTENGNTSKKMELTCLMAVGSNGAVDKIRYYADKEGWQLVKYWLPNTANFADAIKYCEVLLKADPQKLTALEDENANLKAKVAELAAKMKHDK